MASYDGVHFIRESRVFLADAVHDWLQVAKEPDPEYLKKLNRQVENTRSGVLRSLDGVSSVASARVAVGSMVIRGSESREDILPGRRGRGHVLNEQESMRADGPRMMALNARHRWCKACGRGHRKDRACVIVGPDDAWFG